MVRNTNKNTNISDRTIRYMKRTISKQDNHYYVTNSLIKELKNMISTMYDYNIYSYNYNVSLVNHINDMNHIINNLINNINDTNNDTNNDANNDANNDTNLNENYDSDNKFTYSQLNNLVQV